MTGNIWAAREDRIRPDLQELQLRGMQNRAAYCHWFKTFDAENPDILDLT